MGEELVFEYKGEKYFLQGWSNESGSQMVLNYATSDDSFSGYIWECSNITMKLCADAFLKEPLWEGKDFFAD